MTDHALLAGTAPNALEQPAGAGLEPRHATPARSYYNLAGSYSVLGFAGRKTLPEPVPPDAYCTVQRPMECLSRPPRLLAAKPLADAAELLHVPVPVHPTDTPLVLPAFSPSEGTRRPVTTCAHSPFRTVAMNDSTLVVESAVAEGKAKPALHPPARNVRVRPAAEIIASPFAANCACVEQLPQCGQTVLPTRRLRNRHASQTRTPPKSNKASSSATLWSEASLEENMLAFFGSQDGAMGLAASLSLGADHNAPACKDSSWAAVDTAHSSLCGLSISDCIFSAETTVTDKSSASSAFRGRVIDPQAALSFHRDGARRHRGVPKAGSDAEFR
ncbi:hypothetical protein LSCM1_02997 [Leishmania martiniquensis]|uniref:Uncharacterized protein n=1 Tax=Leishmania martiniquensis TaxID=1580590 RepID=A0A836GS65_9TRYP|nr:hypothetical protein LSCM1_02997 [Leishmania martiniquensis]